MHYKNKATRVTQLLRQQRETLALKQVEIGKRLELSQNAYSKIELGYTKMTMGYFFQLCEALTLDEKEVLTMAGQVDVEKKKD